MLVYQRVVLRKKTRRETGGLCLTDDLDWFGGSRGPMTGPAAKSAKSEARWKKGVLMVSFELDPLVDLGIVWLQPFQPHPLKTDMVKPQNMALQDSPGFFFAVLVWQLVEFQTSIPGVLIPLPQWNDRSFWFVRAARKTCPGCPVSSRGKWGSIIFFSWGWGQPIFLVGSSKILTRKNWAETLAILALPFSRSDRGGKKAGVGCRMQPFLADVLRSYFNVQPKTTIENVDIDLISSPLKHWGAPHRSIPGNEVSWIMMVWMAWFDTPPAMCP